MGREGVGGDEPHQQARTGSRVAEIEDIGGLAQPADADAMDMPDTIGVAIAANAHFFERCGRAQDVVALQEPVDNGFAGRQRADHQRPVGNRFVAGNDGCSGESVNRGRNQRRHPVPFHVRDFMSATVIFAFPGAVSRQLPGGFGAVCGDRHFLPGRRL